MTFNDKAVKSINASHIEIYKGAWDNAKRQIVASHIVKKAKSD